MITAWRIIKAKHRRTAFSGAGCNYASGRWHHKMVPMVYTSGTLALAALETFVHLYEEGRYIKHTAISLSIPKKLVIEVENLITLPKEWRSSPAGDSTKCAGSDWQRSAGSAVLSVPSAIIPNERNYLLNPHHPDFTKIVIGPEQPFSFDPRLWK